MSMDRMPQIYFIYEREMPTVEILHAEFEMLSDENEFEVFFRRNVEVVRKDIEDADVLVMVRPHNVLSQRLAEHGRRSGCFVASYLDDDMLDLPENVHSIPWRLRALRRVLAISDAVIAPNPRLSEKYGRMTRRKRGVTVDTCVTETELSEIPEKTASEIPVKLVYAAGRHHSDAVGRYIYPILKRLNETHRDSVTMTFAGVSPAFQPEEFGFLIECRGEMTLDEYRLWMREQSFDIGFAPLEDTPFNRGKYFVKYLEYSLAGTVGIYSRCEPYTCVIEDGKNGYLADSEEEWIEKTLRLIDDAALRRKFLLGAKRQLGERFDRRKIYASLKQELPELFEKKSKCGRCGDLLPAKLRYRVSLALDSGYLFVHYLRRSGLRSTIARTTTHFRINRMYQNKGEKK